MLFTSKITSVRAVGCISILTVAVLIFGQVATAARPRSRPQQPPGQPRTGPTNQQRTAQPRTTPSKAAAPKRQTAAEEMPKPEEIRGSQLQTRDGVALSATFYPGTNEKESVPVLLLHNWKSSRREFALLAPELQKKGCAVLAPDLRGHGASTTKITIGRGRGREEKLNASKFRSKDFTEMAQYDMRALRTFLVKKNNDGQLNLNKLVIVGSEMGAALAMVWAAYDWSVPNYEHAGIKQGQDVKALVLVSPKWSYTGLDTAAILNARGPSPVRDRVSVMLLAGDGDSRRLRDVERLESKFVLNRPQPEEKIDRTVLFFPFPTTLQAEKLLNFPRFPIPTFVCRFVEERVINGEPDAVWMEHR
jgi:pimeloyl-ACP methyl ester carboxylesterase